MWARLLNAALGIWLMAAPAVLGYGAPAQTADRIVGPVAASFAIIAISEVTRALRHVNLLLGAWLLLAPWLIGYAVVPTVNSLLVGAAMIALSRVRGPGQEEFGGGWLKLWSGYEPLQRK